MESVWTGTENIQKRFDEFQRTKGENRCLKTNNLRNMIQVQRFFLHRTESPPLNLLGLRLGSRWSRQFVTDIGLGSLPISELRVPFGELSTTFI